MRALRDHLTYANVTATLALFLAASGVAWAASLPRNSVGSAQLKRNAVTGTKVKNGSLTAADLKAGTLTAGAKGDTGPAGPQGPKGDTGPTGPSDAFTGVKEPTPLTSVGTSLAAVVTTPTLPAGSYVVTARANVVAGGGVTNQLICALGQDTAQNFQVAIGNAFPLAMATTEVLTAPGTLSLACSRSAGTPQVAHARIIATKVATLTGQPAS